MFSNARTRRTSISVLPAFVFEPSITYFPFFSPFHEYIKMELNIDFFLAFIYTVPVSTDTSYTTTTRTRFPFFFLRSCVFEVVVKFNILESTRL